LVPHRGGIGVERTAGNGCVVRATVPLDPAAISRHNAEVSKATSGAAYARKATREVRAILTSRMLFAKSRAASRQRDFSLTIDGLCEQYDAQRGLCAVTGLPMDVGAPAGGDTKWRKPFRVSLDRIDSAQGYTPENVRLVCSAVNNALGPWGEAVFAIIAQAYLARGAAT